MSVTLTVNYKEIFKAETVELIEELLEDNHDLNCMLEFIDENDEDTFVTYYEDYVDQGEKVGYDVVDAFVEENGFCDVEHCEDAFVGIYASGADFAEEYSNDIGDNIPSHIIVDWDATWERSLSYDFDAVEKGYRNCYVFRRYY
jgi:antirestriction protein